MRGGGSEIPTDNQELHGTNLGSRNTLTSFHCPKCDGGFWMGYAAKSFENTFRFSSCEGINETRMPLVTKVTAPPPADMCFVNDGEHGYSTLAGHTQILR